MNTTAAIQINRSTILFDIAILGIACFIPAASHLFAFPLYHLDPMRLLLFIIMLLGIKSMPTTSLFNSLAMAVLLPFVSYFITGMPTLPKALIICAELTTNIALFYFFNSRLKIENSHLHVFSAMLFSILGAKCVYYCLKGLCISAGLLQSPIISTAWYTQIIVLTLLALLFSLLFPKTNKQ